jgi:hypothetical protein
MSRRFATSKLIVAHLFLLSLAGWLLAVAGWQAILFAVTTTVGIAWSINQILRRYF